MNKTYKITLVIALLSIVILVIGSSYAYFKTTITGNSESISIKSGKMELTFDDGTSLVSLPNAKPGDYMTKDFNVENTSTINSSYDYEYIYNIKLVDVEVTFEQEDLEYKLEEYTDETYTTLKPNGVKESGYINEETITEEKEMYLAARITRPPKGEKHYYRLTITFKNLEDVNQNYNQGAEFSAKINIDDNKRPSFGTHDLELAIYVDGDKKEEFPKNVGTEYVFENIVCTTQDITTAEWDYDKDGLSILTKGPNKCDISFSTKFTMDFVFNNNIQSYEISKTGYYKLEVWGAQGANSGGQGGYSYGSAMLEKGTTIYIVVGGEGTGIDGGYNGGGKIADGTSENNGGGATHIATVNGLLSELDQNKDDILIVAGGGGAGAYGGAGGGTTGVDGTYVNQSGSRPASYYGYGGTQTGPGGGYWTHGGATANGVAGAFGKGAYNTGGGGGGYYGGGCYSPAHGGGSGYLKSTLLNANTQQGGNTGNGKAKITFEGYNINFE